VEAGTVVAEIMTEKVTNLLEAATSGTVLKIVVRKGEKAPVGAPIAVLGEPGEDISELLAASRGSAPAITAVAGGEAAASARISVSPAARALAEELGLDLSRVVGTGSGGRITRDDVRAAEAQGTAVADVRPVRREIEYAGMRRAIGEHMAMSWTVAPKVTHHGSVDVSEMMAFRARLNSGKKDRDKVSVTAIVVKTVAGALDKMPQINATLDGDVIHVWQEVNVGVAMALPEGLIVPVVRDANLKGFNEIGLEISAFGRQAARGRLAPDDLTGGTFTVTNVGGYGSVDWFTPIINQPESAILGVGRTVQSVVAVDGNPVVRPTMGLSLSFDHRVIDGAPAASFLAMVMGFLTNPYAMIP
jgi:pyruvate dehydrogenase E2 component (dihydrolipoamide acetyltransferase)